MPLPLQLFLIPVVLPVAYAIGWCLPHLWHDLILWQTISRFADRPRPTHWWIRRHISNYRCLQWRHALRHPLSPYPDLTS